MNCWHSISIYWMKIILIILLIMSYIVEKGIQWVFNKIYQQREVQFERVSVMVLLCLLDDFDDLFSKISLLKTDSFANIWQDFRLIAVTNLVLFFLIKIFFFRQNFRMLLVSTKIAWNWPRLRTLLWDRNSGKTKCSRKKQEESNLLWQFKLLSDKFIFQI